MKVVTENWLDLGDAGQHQVTAVGFCQANGGQVNCLVDSVTIETKGAPEINVWPLLKLNGMAPDVEQWLLDAFDCHCKSVVETIRELQYRERGGLSMSRSTDADELRLTLLEMQVGALLQQREALAIRIRRLREYIDANCQHSALGITCPTCRFLQEDARC